MLTDEEQAFLRDFADKRYSLEKLFSDTDILDRIRSLRWWSGRCGNKSAKKDVIYKLNNVFLKHL